jgi:hypothetical protein
MRRQIAAALCSVVLGFMASSPLAMAGSSPQDRQAYTSIRDLMQSIIDPSADVLWTAVGTIVDKEKGIQDLSPKTPQDWLDVRRAAVRILEGGNLLMMPRRQAAPTGAKSETPGVELEPAQITALIRKNRRTFDAFARSLQVLGLEALRASEAKNADVLMDVGARMENVCESCHQRFWYPPLSPSQSGGQGSSP